MTERIITRTLLERGDVRPAARVLARVTGEPTLYGTVDCVDLSNQELIIRWDNNNCIDILSVYGFEYSAEEEAEASMRVYLIDEAKQFYTVLHYNTVKLCNANREEVKEFFATLEDSVGWSVIEQQHIKPVKLTKRVVYDVDF